MSWKSPGIGRNLAYLFWLGLAGVFLLLFSEYLKYWAIKIQAIFTKICTGDVSIESCNYDTNCYESDVAHEKQTVNNNVPKNYCLYLK